MSSSSEIQHLRIGQGYDIHRMACRLQQPELGPFMVGGVCIHEQVGLLAHSDGDVVLHALMDALLGATAMGDIGDHFPPSNPDYADADSAVLLAKTLELLQPNAIQVNNVDITIFLETPKLGEFKLAIRQKISELLGVDVSQVSVKAKTAEKLGDIGSGAAIAASVTVLLHATV